MPVKKIKECCDFAFAAIDGAYGWLPETFALLTIVVIFNFVIRWFLKKLHHRFERQNQVWHDSFVRALYKPLSYYVWFFAIVHVVDLISHRVFEDGASLENMHMILALGGVIAMAWFLLRWKKNMIHSMLVKSKNKEIALDVNKIDVINKVLTILIFFITILLILEITNRSVNTLIAFGGVGGLALAFASQEIIANFFAGLMIYATHPFSKGDWILIPERNIEGIVDEIGWYMTLIKGLDKRPLYVPNSVFSRTVVVNPSRMSHRQIKETIGLRYNDLSRMKDLMADIKTMLKHHPEIDKDYSIIVNFTAFGSYSLDFIVSAYTTVIENEPFARVKDEILFKIADIIAAHGAEIAFPSSCVIVPEPISLVEKKS